MALKWLSRLIGKKEDKGAAEKINLEAAMKMLSDIKNKEGKQLLEGLEKSKNNALSSLKRLQNSLRELRKVTPEEPRAQASKQVKDAFAEKMMSLIENFSMDRKISSAEEYDSFAKECARFVQAGALSQKEAMHVKFFFEEHMRNAALAIKQFSADAQAIPTFLDDYRKRFAAAEKAVEDFRQAQEAIDYKSAEERRLEESAGKLSYEAQRMSEEIKQPEGLEKARNAVSEAETSARQKEEEINSLFFSISKILRKYGHATASKDEEMPIKRYIESPASALKDDENLAICRIIDNAIEGGREIELNEKETAKIREFPGRDRILSCRKGIIAANIVLDERKRELAPLEEKERQAYAQKRIGEELRSRAEIMKEEVQQIRKDSEHLNALKEGAKRRLEKALSTLAEKNIAIL